MTKYARLKDYGAPKPKRHQLNGMSYSELKSILKHRGHKVPRNMWFAGYVTKYKDRLYRFRWWSEGGFVVDVSCPFDDFDRWANSVDRTISFNEWMNND